MRPDQQNVIGPGRARPGDFQVGAFDTVDPVCVRKDLVALFQPGGGDVIGGGTQRLRPEHIPFTDCTGQGFDMASQRTRVECMVMWQGPSPGREPRPRSML